MKKIIIVFIPIFFLACKKNYVCQCTNTSTTYDAGEIEATKAKAKKQCQELSTSTTTCKLK